MGAGEDTTITARFVADTSGFNTEKVVEDAKAVESATADMSKGLSEVESATGSASKGLSEVGVAGEEASKGMGEVGSASGEVATKVEEVGGASEEASDKVKKTGDAAKEAGGGFGNMAMQSIQAVQQIAQFGQMVGQAVASIGQLHDAAVATGDAFLYLTQDADKANTMLGELSQTAASKDYGAQNVDNVAQHMLMLGKNTSTVVPEITKVADGLAAMGKGSAQLDSVVTSMDKLNEKSRITMSDIDSLADKGLPAWQALASGMGVSVDQAQAKVKAGGVEGSKALDDMMKGLTQYGGAAEAQSQTLAPEWDRFTKNLQGGLSFISDAFAKDLAALNSFMEGIDSLDDKVMKLGEAAKVTMEALTTIGSFGLNNVISGALGAGGGNSGVTPSSTVSSTLGLPGHASGGTNLSGLSVIGENGPELFDPSGGSIYPLADGGSSSLSSLPAMGGQSGPVTIQILLDSMMLAQQILPQLAPMIRVQTGRRV
jgi:tape measure domain-containing protein